ncbi:hypothetical protein EDC04DRAFT_2941065 [Pisolithus marmoratus]|nr:hypothetical protein EDC04DRAFT_2941065 [Pisolithus marmoratus]
MKTPGTPGLMWNCLRCRLPPTCDLSRNHPDYLCVDHTAIPVSLIESELKVGDYGRVPQGGDMFKPEGNIFQFGSGLGLDCVEVDTRSIHRPKLGTVQSIASLILWHPKCEIAHELPLYGITGWLLPANQQVVSLLEALCFHIAGKLLVTAVIHRSDRRPPLPRLDTTLTPSGISYLDKWVRVETATPLCSVTMPPTWSRRGLEGEPMTPLQKIIDSFSVLVGWADKLDEPMHSRESTAVETSVEFFVDIFCGGDIRNFIGEIVFFRELLRIMEKETHTEPDTGTDNGRYPTQDVSGRSEATVIPHVLRINALVAFLAEIDDKTFDLQLTPEFDVRVGSDCTGWMTLWKNGFGWRSAPFAAQVLRLIAKAYMQTELYEGTENLRSQNAKFDRREFLSDVEKIKEWREMVIATNDEHERRTLVEDTVGKIVDRYLNDEVVEDDNAVAYDETMNESISRFNRLWEVGRLFSDATDYIPDGNSLQRIMDDARDEISKHQLLLRARAALASLSNEAGQTLKRKRGSSVSAEPPTHPCNVAHIRVERG